MNAAGSYICASCAFLRQKVRLQLPEGMTVSGPAETTVEEAAKRTQVFWRVTATREGTFKIEATSG